MAVQHIGNWGQTLIEALQRQGISNQAIIGNSGINIRALEGDDPRISFSSLALLFERAADLTSDDLIAFKLGQSSDYRRGGLFAYTGVSSPNVRTLLTNLARYQRVTGDALMFDAKNLEKDSSIEWSFKVPMNITRNQYVEFNSALLINTIRRLTNRKITPQTVHFRHFRKTNIEAFSTFFGCPIAFGADSNRILFKSGDLILPLRSADDHLFHILTKVSQDTIKRHGSNKSSIVNKIEDCLAGNPSKSQAEVAKEIGMSRRTLARRLADAGTSFSAIVETFREAMAKSMLSDTEFPLTEIAFVLGYSDPSTFSTAFKRWAGQTPTEYRDLNSK